MPNVIFCDSFDHYATADFLKKWSTTDYDGGTITATGRNGTNAYEINIHWAAATKNLGASYQSLYVEFALYTTAWNTSYPYLTLMDGSTAHVELRYAGSGELSIERNGTVLGTTSGLGLSASTWYHIGLYAKIDDSAGEYTLRVNGVSVLTGTSKDTRNGGNASANAVRISSPGSNPNTRFDDFIVSTDGFCGDCRVKAVFPDGNGNYTQFTPSAGSAYQCVDEASMNSDTDYVADSAVGHRASYTFGAVGVTGAVKAVQHVTTARKDDAGSRTINQFMRISGTDYDGSDLSVTDSYTMHRRCMATSPATGSPWSIAEIDGAEAGTEVAA